MTTKTKNESPATAANLVNSAEKASLGSDVAAVVDAARAAVAADLLSAGNALAPSLFAEPVSADVIAHYKLALEQISPGDAPARAAAIHAAALGRNPELARLMRAAETVEFVAQLASGRLAVDGATAYVAAKRGYLIALAEALDGPSARDYLAAIALEDRLNAAVAAHAEAERLEAERAEAERKAEHRRKLDELDAERAAAERAYHESSIGSAGAAEREFLRARNGILARRIRLLGLADIRAGSSLWDAGHILGSLEGSGFSDVQLRVLEGAVQMAEKRAP